MMEESGLSKGTSFMFEKVVDKDVSLLICVLEYAFAQGRPLVPEETLAALMENRTLHLEVAAALSWLNEHGSNRSYILMSDGLYMKRPEAPLK